MPNLPATVVRWLSSELAKSNPVFAPGQENYERMGGLNAIWHDDLAAKLREALVQDAGIDRRSERGLARGGRRLAQRVIEQVQQDDVRAAA